MLLFLRQIGACLIRETLFSLTTNYKTNITVLYCLISPWNGAKERRNREDDIANKDKPVKCVSAIAVELSRRCPLPHFDHITLLANVKNKTQQQVYVLALPNLGQISSIFVVTNICTFLSRFIISLLNNG